MGYKIKEKCCCGGEIICSIGDIDGEEVYKKWVEKHKNCIEIQKLRRIKNEQRENKTS